MPIPIQGLTVDLFQRTFAVQQGLLVRDLPPRFTNGNVTLAATGITTAAFTFLADAAVADNIFRRATPNQAKRLLPGQRGRAFPRS